MIELNKILVGVDPLQARHDSFLPPVMEAIRQAVWLAEPTSSEITFLSALDSSESTGAAVAALDKLAEQAQARGVAATSKVVPGNGWMALAREAIDGRYDLVFVGTRDLGPLHRALFGSTAKMLVHHCPTAVWVTKPEPHPTPANVLVASDFTEVSDKALRLALRIGLSRGSRVHLIHVFKSPFALLSDADEAEARGERVLHEQDRAEARRRLDEQFARVAGDAGLTNVSIADVTYLADDAIAKYIETHHIDLLAVGSSARHGVEGVIPGNTAERLLTTVNCSLLVVKPDDFVCPVPLL